MSKDFGTWNETAEGYPKFEKGKMNHRLHWQKCLFLAGQTQGEAYEMVKHHVSIELPAIESIPGYIAEGVATLRCNRTAMEETID